MRFINLCTVDNEFDANMIREYLAEEEIQCIVTNEHFTALMPHLNGMLGSGIRILVAREQMEAAREIVHTKTKQQVVACPKCESKNISYGLGTTQRSKRLLGIFISLLAALPVQHIKPTYYCNDCKAEFGQ